MVSAAVGFSVLFVGCQTSVGCRVVGIATFTFQQDGIFVSTTALQSANYVTSCCDFAQQSFTSSFMSLALFVLSLALLLLFFILLVRSLRDFNAKCVASKATSAVKSDAAATVEPSVDARLAEAEAEELADMIGSHRMVRSESMDSLGTVAPRSKRMQIRYRLRKLGEAVSRFVVGSGGTWNNVCRCADLDPCSRLVVSGFALCVLQQGLTR